MRKWPESGSKVGDGGGDDGDGGDGKIFPGHPGPILNVPRDNISRKGIPSLRRIAKRLARWNRCNTCSKGSGKAPH